MQITNLRTQYCQRQDQPWINSDKYGCFTVLIGFPMTGTAGTSSEQREGEGKWGRVRVTMRGIASGCDESDRLGISHGTRVYWCQVCY